MYMYQGDSQKSLKGGLNEGGPLPENPGTKGRISRTRFSVFPVSRLQIDLSRTFYTSYLLYLMHIYMYIR